MTTLTKEQFAAMLDGREYGNEITRAEQKLAKDNGLVVVFGASDDLIEFVGCIDDEGGCYDGGTIPIVNGKLLPQHDDCDCDYCGYKAMRAKARTIEAVWSDSGEDPAWTYETDIPHSTFTILEDGEPYCRGIVFYFSEVA